MTSRLPGRNGKVAGLLIEGLFMKNSAFMTASSYNTQLSFCKGYWNKLAASRSLFKDNFLQLCVAHPIYYGVLRSF
jgi:hypothetical protein